MASLGLHAWGTILKVGNGQTGTETFTAVAEISSITSSLTADELDVTSHDSLDAWREFVRGLKSMEITLEGNYIPASATHDMTINTGMLWLFDEGTQRNYQLVFPDPDNTQFEFKAITVEVTHTADVEDKLAFTSRLRVTGEPTFTGV
jgi:predicted secreted protein